MCSLPLSRTRWELRPGLPPRSSRSGEFRFLVVSNLALFVPFSLSSVQTLLQPLIRFSFNLLLSLRFESELVVEDPNEFEPCDICCWNSKQRRTRIVCWYQIGGVLRRLRWLEAVLVCCGGDVVVGEIGCGGFKLLKKVVMDDGGGAWGKESERKSFLIFFDFLGVCEKWLVSWTLTGDWFI